MLPLSLSSQTRDTIFLWPNNVPDQISPKHPAVVKKGANDNVIRLTDITNPSLTVFKPENANASHSAVIVCPGGGYNILAIDKEGYEIANWLNGLGYTAFVLQYRVPNKRLGALQDIQRAIRMVRSKADAFNLDPQKIGIMGFSAGGHLSALASTSYENDSYFKLDELDALSSRPNFTALIYPAYLDNGIKKTISPEIKIDQNSPPCFVFSTADDKFGNSALVMSGVLRDKKVPVELHMLNSGGHGYGLRKGNTAAETWPKLMEKWLNSILK